VVGPLVVNEIMYHPPAPNTAEASLGYTAQDFEFIELYNRSAAPVTLMADRSGVASNNFLLAGGVGFTCGWYQDHSGANNTSEVWTLEPGATATWTTTRLQAGVHSYGVYAHYQLWEANGKERDLDNAAQYTINYSGGSITKSVNQDDTVEYPPDANGHVSVFLGTFPFDGTGSVRLTRGVTNPVDWTSADTVEFRPAGQQTPGIMAETRVLDSYWTQHPITTVAPGAYVVLVGNLAAFNVRYQNEDGHIPVLGAYSGRLADDDDELKLYWSEQEWDAGASPYYQYDHVHYYDRFLNGVAAPWPTEPDGAGPALGRLHIESYGNDGGNWGITNYLGTPGAANYILDPNPPNVPNGVTAQAALVPAPSITVTWNASTAPGSYVDHYVVYRDGALLATVPSPHAPPVPPTFSYVDSDVAAAPVAYFYQVSAVNRDQYASVLSPPASGGFAAFISFDAPATTQLNVNFSEAVRPTAGYTVSGLTVQEVTLSPNQLTATVALAPSTPLVPGNRYTLSVTGAATLSGHILPATQDFIFTYQPPGSAGTGKILRQYWTGITGTAVSALTGSPNYPDHPNGTSYPITFDATPNSADWANDYGTRMAGYVCPPTSGNYVFYIAADETAELWLSTDEDPAHKVKIATVPAFTNEHEWVKYPAQKSVEVWLGAGRRYYVEALQKEGTGNDSVSVAWQTPGTSFNPLNAKPIPTGNLMPYDVIPPTAASIDLVGNSLTGAASVRFSVTFSEPVIGVDPADFQLAVSGATGTVATVTGSGTNYTVTVANVAGNGTLGLNLVDNDSIADPTGNPLAGNGTNDGSLVGPAYQIDTTPPVAVSVNRNGTNPTNSATLKWSVAFSKNVTGVDASDFRLALSGVTGSITQVTGSNASYMVTATVAGAGTAGLNLADDNTILDAAGNALNGPGTADPCFIGQVYNVDTTAQPLVYWLKPIAGGTGDYSVSGSYSGGDPNPDNAYAVSINSLPTGPATINFQLYAGIGGRDTGGANDSILAGLLDILNRPGSSGLAGQPSPVALRSPLNGSGSSAGQVNADIDGTGGLDVGGALTVTTYPGANSAWIKPYYLLGAAGTAVNANGWTDILLGTLSFTYGATAAAGQWAQLGTAAVTYNGGGSNYAQIWKLDGATQRENDGNKIRSGPPVTIAVRSLLSIDSASRQEGSAGTVDYVFTAALSRPCAQPVQVTVDTSDGTATTADNDYQALHRVLTFLPGETTQVFNVRVNSDTKVEGDENFFVTLSNPLYDGAAAPSIALAPLQNAGVATIVNDDSTTVSLAAVNADQPEGDAGPTAFTFAISLSAPSAFATTIEVDTADGTASAADGDYAPLHQIVTFAPGETSRTVTVDVAGDALFEADETFSLVVSDPIGPGTVLGSADTATGTIRNDDAGRRVSIAPVGANKAEGHVGLEAFTFAVSLSVAGDAEMIVDVDTADGTATAADHDYLPLHQTVTFAPGETSKIVTVEVEGDARLENDESFTVRLARPVGGAALGTATATGTIVNDDDTIFLGPGGASLRIRRDPVAPDPGTALVFVNGAAAPTYSFPLDKFPLVHVAGATGDDELIVDFANGPPLPSRGLAFGGGGGVEGDRLVLEGLSGYVMVGADAVRTEIGTAVAYSGVRFFGLHLQPNPANQLSIDRATLRVNEDNALAPDMAVGLVNGAVLDLNGHAATVGQIDVTDGSVIGGTLTAGSYVVRKSSIGAGLAGAGELRKTTAGATVLTGNNSYRGGTIVDAGILHVGNAAAVPAGGTLTIGAGAKLVLAPGLIHAVASAAVSAPTAPAAAEVSPLPLGEGQGVRANWQQAIPLAEVLTGPNKTGCGAAVSAAYLAGETPAPPETSRPLSGVPDRIMRIKAHDLLLQARDAASWGTDLAWLWEFQQSGNPRRRAAQPQFPFPGRDGIL
jgi:autotransporter-associated beta strand protein